MDGGRKAGEVASKMASEGLYQHIVSSKKVNLESLVEAFHEVMHKFLTRAK